MILDHLGDEAVQGAATRGRLLQNPRAFVVSLNGSFDGIDLSAKPLEPIQQLALFVCHMTHRSKSS
jgi:hypothetical protein